MASSLETHGIQNDENTDVLKAAAHLIASEPVRRVFRCTKKLICQFAISQIACKTALAQDHETIQS
jgi:hypothetical protein